MSRRAIRTATTGSLPLVAAIAAFLLVTGAHAQTVNFQVVVNAQNPLVVGEGGTVGYSLRTRGVPTHDVTVGIGGHTGTDVSLSDTSLLIVTDNSDVFFTVIVTAAEDDDAVDDRVVLTHTVTTGESVTTARSVTVVIRDNDTAGVTISEKALTVGEGDSTGAGYTVVLDSEPSANVTVAVSGHAGSDVSPSPTSLTFTPDNWNTVQTVTVTAAEDPDAVSDQVVTLTHAVTGTGEYAAVTATDVTVTVTDDDTPGVTISETALTVDEGDATGLGYTVVLDTEPSANVTVAVSGHAGSDVSPSPTSLTFTPDNWNTVQTVTVTAAEDPDAVSDQVVTLTHAVTGTGEYAAVTATDVTVTVTDDDTPGVTISETALTVDEGDATGLGYTVVLDTEPSANVTVAVSGHAGSDVSPSPTSLTFTPDNWNTVQTVTVTAAEDPDAVSDQVVTLTHAVTGTGEYAAVTATDVTVTVTDDDTPGVTISETVLTVDEGDATGVGYTVVLDSQPSANVTVAVSGHADTDVSPSPTNLTFTADNWNTPQAITVTASEDRDAVDDAVTLAHAVTGTGEYAEVTASSVTVTVSDDDTAVTVSFEKEIHYTAEGVSGVAGVEVLLSAPLDREVTIPVRVLSESTAETGDYSLDRARLTFAPGETFGAVFVKALLDHEDEDTEQVVLGFGALPEGLTEGSPNRSTVVLSDLTYVSFEQSSYAAVEGGDHATVTVQLSKPPRGTVVIPLTADGEGGADPRDWMGVPQQLSFVKSEAEKTFVVQAREDTDVENGEMVRLGFGKLPDGFLAPPPDTAMVMITDDDAIAELPAADTPCQGCPPAPRHFAAQWPTQSTLTLLWFTVETAVEYELEVSRHGGGDWTRINGDFDHLPSSSDNRNVYAVAAGLDCDTEYDFRLRARGGGGKFVPEFGPYAAETARTAPCPAPQQITNLLVTQAPDCATLTWTAPTEKLPGGYLVRRTTYTGPYEGMGQGGVGPGLDLVGTETVFEDRSNASTTYRDCSAGYRTPGTSHAYRVHALTGTGESFGAVYGQIARYGPMSEPAAPLNVRLTVSSSDGRRLEWEPAPEPWLTTVLAARGASGQWRPVQDPWPTTYRVERAAYQPTAKGPEITDGRWETTRDESDGDTSTFYVDSTEAGDSLYAYRVWSHNAAGLARYIWFGDWAFMEPASSGLPPSRSTRTPAKDSADTLTKARVSVVDDAGDRASSTSQSVLPATVPDAPSGVRVFPGDVGGLNVSWAPRTASGGSPITGYRVQWRLASGSWESPADVTDATVRRLSHAITGLIGGVEYAVRVIAINEIGDGPPSDDATASSGAAAQQFTAQFRHAPASHGGAAFSFHIAFSEPVAISYRTLRDHSLEVTGGSVNRARRVDGRSDLWEITVEPHSGAAVNIALPANRPCDGHGAVCAPDGRQLSNRPELTVAGPSS